MAVKFQCTFCGHCEHRSNPVCDIDLPLLTQPIRQTCDNCQATMIFEDGRWQWSVDYYYPYDYRCIEPARPPQVEPHTAESESQEDALAELASGIPVEPDI